MNTREGFGFSLHFLFNLILRRYDEARKAPAFRLRVHVNFPLFLTDFNGYLNISITFNRIPIIESHEKSFIPSRAFLFGATGQRAKGQTNGQNVGMNKS
jgi:hypothetical protein